ncbi:head GIN domain-containing protein [Georgenia yuyongxinii]|nr:head GIN domain-containing protein [Georgenia yuyongxinii]
MRRNLRIGLAAGLTGGAAVLTACSAGIDAGPATSEERDVAGATAVVLATAGDLIIRQGETTGLTVTAGENILDQLSSDVRDGVLELGATGSRILGFGDVRYELVLPEVHAVTVTGSGDVEAGVETGTALELRSSGSGSISFHDVAVDDLTVEVTGSGTVRADGRAGTQRARITGSGDYAGEDLTSDSATVEVAGSGSADVAVDGTLDARVSGSGDITYTGDAQVNSQVSGSGSVSRR